MLVSSITSIMNTIIILVVITTMTGSVNYRLLVACFSIYFVAILLASAIIPDENVYYFTALINLAAPIIILISVRKLRLSLLLYISLFVIGLTTSIAALFYWAFSVVPFYLSTVLVELLASILLLISCLTLAKADLWLKFTRGIITLGTKQKVVLVSAIWITVLITGISSVLYIEYSGIPEVVFLNAIIAVLIALLGIAIPLYIISSITGTYYMKLSGIAEKQVQSQVTHYEVMSKIHEDSRKFRHDHTNLLLVLRSMLKRNDVDGALALIVTDEVSADENGTITGTGSVVLDALLTEKQHRALAMNASIEFNGLIPGNLIKPADLCAIFGNAIDNAIEACAKCSPHDKKIISINSKFRDGFLFVTIENPVAEEVSIAKNSVSTTKSNKVLHGIGLNSMRTSVEKNSGKMTLSCSREKFFVSIEFDFNEVGEISQADMQ